MEENDNNNNINETSVSNTKTMEYISNKTKSVVNNTDIDIASNTMIENEAIHYQKRADNKIFPSCCLSTLCSSKEKRTEDACELYRKAGEKYKICKKWKEAGDCFYNCSILKSRLKQNPYNSYQDAFFCYSKAHCEIDSKKMFEKMNKYLEERNEFYKAGKINQNLAIEKESKEKYEDAIIYYLQALNFYEKDGKHEALKCNILIKLSELMIVHNYPNSSTKVPKMFESIGKDYLKNPLTKYVAKDYFGRAVLSILYYENNPEKAKEYLEQLKEVDSSFEDSNIYNLCCEVIDAMKNNDLRGLDLTIEKYKKLSEIDKILEIILKDLTEKLKKTSNIIECTGDDFNQDDEDLK